MEDKKIVPTFEISDSSEDFMKEIATSFANFVLNKFESEINKNNKTIKEIESSNNKNKEELIKKYKEINEVISGMLDTNKKMAELQKEVIELQDKKDVLEAEIAKLFI